MDLVMRHILDSSSAGISSHRRYLDAEVNRDKERKKAVDLYLKKYGIKTAPNRATRAEYFFADDARSL